MSIQQLQGVLDKAASLMDAANGGSVKMTRDELEIRRAELSIKIRGHRIGPDRVKIPDVINYFDYGARTWDPAPVSGIQLSLSDYTRKLTIDGQSPDQVDALFATLTGDLTKLSTSFAGPEVRILIGFPVFGLVCGSLVGLIVAFSQLPSRRRALGVSISLVLAVLVVGIILPINDIFAGTYIVNGDPSLLVIYGPQISFAGLAVGVVATLIALLFPIPVGTKLEKEKETQGVSERSKAQGRASTSRKGAK
jgi:hypothetical protein